MKYFSIILICISLNVFGQLHDRQNILVQIEGHDPLNPKTKNNSKNIELTNQLYKSAKKFGQCTIERAFPYAPETSNRSKDILVKYKKDINIKKLEKIITKDFKSQKLKIDSIPLYSEMFDCEDVSPLPNDMSGQPYTYSNDALIELIQGKCAWNITTGNDNVKIAIIDRLLDVSHVDLNGNTYEYKDFAEGLGDAIHGTLVAGSAAASTNNGFGISSIGYNCSLLLYNASGWPDGIGRTAAVNAIDYAVQQGASIINCSFGMGEWYRLEEALSDAIAAGVSIVAAGGAQNFTPESIATGSGLPYPAFYDDVICVSTVDINNYFEPVNGPYHYRVDICAPVTGYWRTAVGNTYSQPNCCSSNAAPIVSGVLGLMHSVNNGYTPRELRYFVMNTGTRINDQSNYEGLVGGGTINAYRAVRRAASEHLQGDIFNGSTQSIVNDYDIYIGDHVLPDNNFPVLIVNGADITLEADEVIIENSFTVEVGSTLTIN